MAFSINFEKKLVHTKKLYKPNALFLQDVHLFLTRTIKWVNKARQQVDNNFII